MRIKLSEEEKKQRTKEIKKAYYEKNKEKLKLYTKKHYEENKEEILKKQKEYKSKNKKIISDEQKEKRREYDNKRYHENKEELLKRQKKYRTKNKRVFSDEQKERKKEYYQLNKDKVRIYNNEYNKRRRKEDPIFKIKSLIRSRISEIFRDKNYIKKSKTTQQILGCSFDEFKQHLESLWEPWMDWDNHGLYNGTSNHGWDIDHRIPLSTAITEDDVYRLNHYTNLQPLCSYVNRDVKRDIGNA